MKNFQVWMLFLFLSVTVFSNDQYIYSQITKDNLVVTDQYIIDGFNLDGEESVFSVETGDINLEDFLNSSSTYDETAFVQIENERYEYSGLPRSMVKFNLKKNIGEPKEVEFNLTQVDESGDVLIYRRLIDENYVRPAPTSNFREENLEESKNTFIYEDEYRLEHLIAYKYQEVVYRLYTGIKNEEIRPIKKIEVGNNLSEFSDGSINYIDFVFENNGTVQTIEKSGIIGKFIDGKFELMGLEDGKSYNLDLYTLRYRNNNSTANYVVVTNETSLEFMGKNILNQNRIMLESINTENYNEVQINLITITQKDLEKIELLNVKEVRNEITAPIYNDITIDTKVEVENIWIDGQEYIVDENNQIEINDVKRYVYRWAGTYDTSFMEEEGKIRELTFTSRRYFIDAPDPYKDKFLSGKYIEPTPIEKYEEYPHQRIIFETKDGSENLINYELKDQKYQMIDRILTPARLGYRQIKSIDYETTLGGYLLGEDYTNINEFQFENNNWNYPINEGVEGIVVEKIISESAGELAGEGGQSTLFYTDDVGHGLNKVEEGGDKVVYNWTEGPTNTNGVILNYDKVIFRISKMPIDKVITENVSYMVGSDEHTVELPKYYWNPYDKTNPINYLDDDKMIAIGDGHDSEASLKMEAFLFGNTNGSYNENYIDLVMEAGSDKETTFSNAVISYEAANKNLRLIGLPIGEYVVQLYTVKRGHDGTYKVITYENYDTFAMDIPEIASEEFDKENNIHKIDFITTGVSNDAIQVNVNFITKMEREIDLTVANLQSIGLPSFKLSEKNEGTEDVEGVGDLGQISLKESVQRRFLFPLDVVFVIDNSGSMQNEIDAVKDGLTAFGQELYDRGFDVKYNLITFGPEQTVYRIGDWSNNVDQYLDQRNTWWRTYYYMAIYKDKWFDGFTLGGVNPENRREKEKDELIDAFNKISASSGYYKGQENSAWGIHYAIEKLRANGRYLDYSGEITDNSNNGYMPSQKMIILLTDENMDTDNISQLGYSSGNVLGSLYAKLNKTTANGMADNINLTGLFHVRRRGNTANSANTELTKYGEEGVPDLGYKYSWGKNKDSSYWEEWDDHETPIVGIDPSDRGNVYHTDFKYYNTGNNFFMYEMGSSGEHVGGALQAAISNIGIIQRWELSYLTPFNEYDGTTRTVDFKLIGVTGKDGTPISKEIRDLDEYEDKQYTVQEEKLVVEFKDPTGTAPKLSIVDGRGVITFLAKSRYYEMNSSGENIIIEDIIKNRSLDVLKTDGTLLFSRNTDDIAMSLSEDGWSPFKITESNLETILDNRAESWVGVENLPIGTDPVKEILSYIDKVKYRVDGSNNYEIQLKKSEVDGLIAHDLGDNPVIPYFNLVVAGSPVRIDEEYFKELMGDRSDAWYELRNSSTDPNLFSGISSDDFEALDGTRYRIRLGDLDLKELLISTDGEDVELKISKTKLEALDGDFTNFEDFGQQGWYEFNVVLTETEMQILRDAELNGETIEYINLEATAVTDLFTQTKVLEDVQIDVIPPKIVEVSVIDQTLRKFLKSMKLIEDTQVFTNTEAENYSGYTAINESELGDLLSKAGSYVKIGDLLDITIVIEDKNLTENDIYIGIGELGWEKPVITDESTTDINRFKLSWAGVEVGTIGTIGLGNTIEDRFGNKGNQNFGILNIDMTDIIPSRTILDIDDKPIDVHSSDGKYYTKANYNIELGDIGNLYRAGILAFKYDKAKSDNKDGIPTYHHSENGLYTGGIKDTEFEITIDNSITHKTDGEYIGKVYGMSKSGKLIDISDYSDDDFDKILDTNYANAPLSQTIIMVDTVDPVILDKDITIINRTFMDKYGVNSVDSSGTTYVKDGDRVEVSYDIKDFNMYAQEMVSNIKGGYLLDLKGYSVDGLTSEIASSSTGLVDTYTVTYTFTINDSNSIETDIDFNIKGEDKAGNQTVKEETITLNNNKPKDVILEVYETVKDWNNITTQRPGDNDLSSGGYKFTKGGATSLINDPSIYAKISGTGAEVRYLKIEKNGTIDPLFDILGHTSEIKIDGSHGAKFGPDTTNIAVVTPVSVSGVMGDEVELKFIVDTRVNTSYLQGGIIGSLIGRHIIINLSDLKELVGIDGYNYVFVVGEKVVKQGGENNLNGNSFTTIQGGSITGNNIDIDTTSFVGGSRGDLTIVVWDRLGHEKVFEKAYFIPTESLGVKATIEDEFKQRESKLKIIGEGTNDKFKLESSVDKSRE